jgi:hypothetical protein
MKLEEGIRQGGYIHEYARVRLTETKRDVKNKAARVVCVKMVSEEGGRGCCVYRDNRIIVILRKSVRQSHEVVYHI